MVDFAHQLGADRIQYLPRSVLQLLSMAARPVAPAFARQAQAAMVMDTNPMAFDLSPNDAKPISTWSRPGSLSASVDPIAVDEPSELSRGLV